MRAARLMEGPGKQCAGKKAPNSRGGQARLPTLSAALPPPPPLLRRAQLQAMLYSPTTGCWWVDPCHTWGLTGRPCSLGLLTVSTSQSSDLGTLPDFTKNRMQLQLGHTTAHRGGSFPWSLPLALCSLTCLSILGGDNSPFLCGLRATDPVQDYREWNDPVSTDGDDEHTQKSNTDKERGPRLPLMWGTPR